jgi:hypothetical protein
MIQPIFQEWEGQPIRHRLDGYVSATDMCKASNKSFEDWGEEFDIDSYLIALGEYLNVDPNSLMDETANGVWVHSTLAVCLANWLSPVWAIKMHEKLFADKQIKPILEEFLC